MRPWYITDESIYKFIQSALEEDIGEGDHSSLGAFPHYTQGKAQLLVKNDGIIAGVELAEKIFHQYDPQLSITGFKKDGEQVTTGDIVFIVEGSAQSILSTERLVLNCMQRMSGIATYTRALGKLIEGTKARMVDTRKTTPNFRLMEKWAVLIGGGLNHRFALYDMVMLKDNHCDLAGGIGTAINNVREYLSNNHKQLQIEVETRNISEVKEVMAVGGVDVIMLDNMRPHEVKEAVNIIGGTYKTEASGGITESNLRDVAECGVDYISVGALTHSVKSLDLSLKVVK